VPDAGFKSELRAQLVAITARIVAESTPDAAPAAAAALTHPVRAAARSGRSAAGGLLRGLRRPLLGVASAAAVLALLITGAVWISKGALPGDSLYGVKRASENVRLATAGNDVDKGYTYLGFASTRVGEVGKLLGKPSAMALGAGPAEAAGTINSRTASLVTSTLDSADSDSRSGMALLGDAAVAQMSADPLAKLTGWTAGQRAALQDVAARVRSTPALTKRVQTSLTLLQRISKREVDLRSSIGCPCLSQAVSDDLGPTPCSPCKGLTGAVPGTPGGSGTAPTTAPGRSGGAGPGPAGSSGGSLGGGSGETGPGGTGFGGTGPGGTGSAATGSGGGGPTGGVTSGGGVVPSSAPSLPGIPGVSSSGAPISAGTGGITAGIPGVSASLGASGGGIAVPILPTITVSGLPKLP
jgi:hypothetical protein